MKAINDSGGIISVIAQRVGCQWHTARDRIYKSKKLAAAFQHEQETVNDIAEGTVIKSIRDGNTQDAKWWLARIRRDRFSERQEITGADGSELEIKLTWGDE